MKTIALVAFTFAIGCGGAPNEPPAVTSDGDTGMAPEASAGPVVCDLGAHGGPIACDPNEPWWFVASSDGHTDTFATCAKAACPLTVACFVGAQEGYCR